jgi:hypothetical protein
MINICPICQAKRIISQSQKEAQKLLSYVIYYKEILRYRAAGNRLDRYLRAPFTNSLYFSLLLNSSRPKDLAYTL